MVSLEENRLMTKVASLYYNQGMRQAQIAELLDLSQASVSRLLKRALETNIVRISVSTPIGCYPELEHMIESRYRLKEVLVVDTDADYAQTLRNLGAAAAYYLETTIKNGEYIGVSSWSETLLATVNAMQPLNRSASADVIQILGGVGNPNAEMHATQLTNRLARLVNGAPRLLPAPGVVGSPALRDVLLQDSFVQEVIGMFEKVSLALVGIGALEPSRMLASSGNVFSPQELDSLRQLGAVGDICMRFFDRNGNPVQSPLDERVISISLEQLKRVRRTVAVAGGKSKLAAIRAALRGSLVHVLITDRLTAERLARGADRA